MSDNNEEFTKRISELLSFTKTNGHFEITIKTISSILDEIIKDNRQNFERQSKKVFFKYEINNILNTL